MLKTMAKDTILQKKMEKIEEQLENLKEKVDFLFIDLNQKLETVEEDFTNFKKKLSPEKLKELESSDFLKRLNEIEVKLTDIENNDLVLKLEVLKASEEIALLQENMDKFKETVELVLQGLKNLEKLDVLEKIDVEKILNLTNAVEDLKSRVDDIQVKYAKLLDVAEVRKRVEDLNQLLNALQEDVKKLTTTSPPSAKTSMQASAPSATSQTTSNLQIEVTKINNQIKLINQRLLQLEKDISSLKLRPGTIIPAQTPPQTAHKTPQSAIQTPQTSLSELKAEINNIKEKMNELEKRVSEFGSKTSSAQSSVKLPATSPPSMQVASPPSVRVVAPAPVQLRELEMLKQQLNNLRTLYSKLSVDVGELKKTLESLKRTPPSSGTGSKPQPIPSIPATTTVPGSSSTRSPESRKVREDLSEIKRRVTALSSQTEERITKIEKDLETRMDLLDSKLREIEDPKKMRMRR